MLSVDKQEVEPYLQAKTSTIKRGPTRQPRRIHSYELDQDRLQLFMQGLHFSQVIDFYFDQIFNILSNEHNLLRITLQFT